MTEYVRVKWLATGFHSTIPASRFDPEKHKKLTSPATRGGRPIPPKYPPAALTREPIVPPADPSTEDNGHEADHPKE